MNILIIDDHPLFRAGIASVIGGIGDEATLTESSSCEDGLAWLGQHDHPDLILLDLSLPGMDGMTGLTTLREASPATPVVVLSATEDTVKVKQALARGAMGYIPKSAGSEVILNAIRLVLAGGIYLPPSLMFAAAADGVADTATGDYHLTRRQREVLTLLARGLSNKEIADRLSLADNTVRVHVAAILKLLGARNRTEAGYQAVSLGLIEG